MGLLPVPLMQLKGATAEKQIPPLKNRSFLFRGMTLPFAQLPESDNVN